MFLSLDSHENELKAFCKIFVGFFLWFSVSFFLRSCCLGKIDQQKNFLTKGFSLEWWWFFWRLVFGVEVDGLSWVEMDLGIGWFKEEQEFQVGLKNRRIQGDFNEIPILELPEVKFTKKSWKSKQSPAPQAPKFHSWIFLPNDDIINAQTPK
jgi:hypothetical protein